MSYAIMRMNKLGKSDIGHTENHNERKNNEYSNTDIDVEKSCLNYQLIKCDNYKHNIMDRIEKGYTQEKSIRKDAVISTEFLFTSDKDFFDKLTTEETRLFFEKSLEFLEKEFGEQNIISATVHLDETTPHMHSLIVPITEDGRLSMKHFLDGKKDLCKFQDRFYEKISKNFPQLERGKSKDLTNASHKNLKELKKETNYLETQIVLYDKKMNIQKEKIGSLSISDEFKNLTQKYKENVKTKTRTTLLLKKETYYEISENFIDTIIKSLNHVQDAIKINQENINFKKLEENYLKLSSEHFMLKNELTTFKKLLEKPLVKDAIKQQKELDISNSWKKKLEKNKGFDLSR